MSFGNSPSKHNHTTLTTNLDIAATHHHNASTTLQTQTHVFPCHKAGPVYYNKQPAVLEVDRNVMVCYADESRTVARKRYALSGNVVRCVGATDIKIKNRKGTVRAFEVAVGKSKVTFGVNTEEEQAEWLAFFKEEYQG